MALDERKLAFIGGGHITRVIIENLVGKEKVYTHRLIVSDPDKKKLQRLYDKYEISMAENNPDAAARGDFVFINVPPRAVGDVLAELNRKRFPDDKVIISLAAGIPMKAYHVLGEQIPVVRALPNPASQIGAGIAALAFNPHVTAKQKKDILELFSFLGKYVILPEDNINAVTALSSPVLTYMFFQSLIEAGIRTGLELETATIIAYQTIVGSMEVWNRRQIPPYELISEASTPGGISVESLFTLEKYAFKAAVSEAIYHGAMKAARLGHSLQKAEFHD